MVEVETETPAIKKGKGSANVGKKTPTKKIMKKRDPSPPPAAVIKNNEPLSTTTPLTQRGQGGSAAPSDSGGKTTNSLIALATEKGRLEMQLQCLDEKLKCLQQEENELKRKGENDARKLQATGKVQVWISMFFIDMYVCAHIYMYVS